MKQSLMKRGIVLLLYWKRFARVFVSLGFSALCSGGCYGQHILLVMRPLDGCCLLLLLDIDFSSFMCACVRHFERSIHIQADMPAGITYDEIYPPYPSHICHKMRSLFYLVSSMLNFRIFALALVSDAGYDVYSCDK